MGAGGRWGLPGGPSGWGGGRRGGGGDAGGMGGGRLVRTIRTLWSDQPLTTKSTELSLLSAQSVSLLKRAEAAGPSEIPKEPSPASEEVSPVAVMTERTFCES